MKLPAWPTVRRWLSRLGIGLVACLAVATAAGTTYEMWSRRNAERAYPAPGARVDIGGRHMHVDCRGSGSPTVVFEAGLDTMGSLSWSAVHDPIAKLTRACAYDRAGIMWSDPSGSARNGEAVAQDLHKALVAANERGPFVLVGHSLGGPYIMTYTKDFPGEVAGLVFVDASHPDQERRFKQILGKEMGGSLGPYNVAAAFTWTGVPRLMWPKEGQKASAKVLAMTASYGPTSLAPMLEEATAISQTMQAAGELRALGDRPVIVLTATAPIDDQTLRAMEITRPQAERFQQEWVVMQREEAAWSSRGTERQFKDATHYIQYDRPDAVIAAVGEVVESVRAPH
jgi:pimeloyl-ACP methyl ester carboxylesterase